MTRARRGLPLLGLAAVFFWLRLTHLAALPVFLDEAIHVDWALRIAQTGRLLGITDGGRYLPIWLYSLVLPHTATPLLAARSLSAIFGFGAMLGLIALGRVLYRSGAGLVAALLYLVLPSALLYDRMALVESLLVAVVLFTLLTSAIWADRGRLGWALVTGALIGVAADTKLYGALAVLAPLLAMTIRPGVRRRDLVPQMYLIGGVALVVMLPAFLELTLTLRFVSENVWLFRSGPHGQASLARNIASAAAWTFDALTPLGCALGLLSGVHALRRRDAADGLLLGFWLLWTVFFVLTGGRDWFPRYLLPAQVPVLLFAARHTELLAGELAGRLRRPRLRFWLPAGLVLAVALPSLPKDVALLVRPEDAALSGIDRWQYIEDWPSGYRLDDLLTALDAEAARVGPLLVLRDAGSGPLFESLNLLLREKPRPALEFVDVDFRRPALLATLRRLRADSRPTLVALDQPVGHPLLLQLDGRALASAVAVLVKPGRFRQLEVYCLAGACAAPPISRVDRRSLDL
ncbi:MAG TPA: glycosyltransferase family 39 protein, partial [Thermoleophilia bacterium]|nr:glycosyltransferase family 39 protein [Thermoleophilia bacterium]